MSATVKLNSNGDSKDLGLQLAGNSLELKGHAGAKGSTTSSKAGHQKFTS